MKPDPILEELWAIKDKLSREAGYDTHRFLENLRQWEAEHPPIARAQPTGLALKEEPPPKN